MSPYRDPLVRKFGNMIKKKSWARRAWEEHDEARVLIGAVFIVGFLAPSFVLVAALVVRAWTHVFAFFGVQ